MATAADGAPDNGDGGAEDIIDGEVSSMPLALPAHAGRQFAALNGDYNPIHIYGWAARLFGFRTTIVHAMYVQTRCLPALLRALGPAGHDHVLWKLDLRRPLFLPSEARLVTRARGRAVAFTVVDAATGKVAQEGSIALL
jgi:acyl dehydratase